MVYALLILPLNIHTNSLSMFILELLYIPLLLINYSIIMCILCLSYMIVHTAQGNA
jgi:hypothetical protein